MPFNSELGQKTAEDVMMVYKNVVIAVPTRFI